MMCTVLVVFEHVEAGTAGAEENHLYIVVFRVLVSEFHRFFHAVSLHMWNSLGFSDLYELRASRADESSIADFLFHELRERTEVVAFVWSSSYECYWSRESF